MREKSFKFSVNIIKFSKHMRMVKKEYILSNQLKRSGTSVGANIEEAQYAPTKKDFGHKLYIALKEAAEAKYWLCLIKDGEEAESKLVDPLLKECEEIISLLTAITKKIRYRED
nr:four helix bundle protein [Alkaliphilus serpentinus]